MLHRHTLVTGLVIGALASGALLGCSKREENGGSSSSQPAGGQASSAPGASAEPQPVTKGPYTWAPGINTGSPMYVKCWAALRTDPSPSFSNPFDQIKGPVEVSSLRGLDASGAKLNHADWAGKVTSIAAGPTARVTLYAEEDFQGASHVLAPGEKATLAETGLPQIGSMKIEFVEGESE